MFGGSHSCDVLNATGRDWDVIPIRQICHSMPPNGSQFSRINILSLWEVPSNACDSDVPVVGNGLRHSRSIPKTGCTSHTFKFLRTVAF